MTVTRNLLDWLDRRGVHVMQYRWTPAWNRQRMLDHYGIDLLVDVGANVGQYATAMRRAGYQGRLLSIEPLESAFKHLASASSSDDLWDVRRAAVGAQEGVLDLHVSEKSIFSSALPVLSSAVAADGGALQVRTEQVPLLTLDGLVAAEDFSQLAVKVDVQGFERDVLEGASETLRRARIVEMELSPSPVYEGQMLMSEAMERMDSVGFVLSLPENLLRDMHTGRCMQFNGVFVRAE